MRLKANRHWRRPNDSRSALAAGRIGLEKQVIAVHRGYCSTHKEGHVVEFEGPVLTDPGLERLAIAVRRALLNEG